MKRNTKIKSQRKSGKKGKRYRDGRRERETHTNPNPKNIETMIERGIQRGEGKQKDFNRGRGK